MCGMIDLKQHTCSFLGHREIEITEELENRLQKAMEDLICEKKVDTFLFGSKSAFDRLSLKIVTKCKENYPHIQRIYVRAEYPDIGERYKAYLERYYDDSFFPEKIRFAGRAVYVERNFEMIRQSRYCIFYFDVKMIPANRKSGTEIALNYAKRQGRDILLLP